MILYFEDIENSSLQMVKETLYKQRKDINKIRLRDLTLCGSGNGVYSFWNGKTCEYVGKASSRSIIERIPAHFDHRDYAWMASYRDLLRKIFNLSHEDAIRTGLERSLSIIIFSDSNNNRKYCEMLEKLLKFILKPYNALGRSPAKLLEDNTNSKTTIIDALNVISSRAVLHK